MQHLDKSIDVKKSSLHEAIRRFVSDLKGSTAGAKSDQSDTISPSGGVTADAKAADHSIIREVKHSDLVYRFNPRKLWQNLVERQLVAAEGHIYHQATWKCEIAKALKYDVEPLFKQLAIANAREVGAKRPL